MRTKLKKLQTRNMPNKMLVNPGNPIHGVISNTHFPHKTSPVNSNPIYNFHSTIVLMDGHTIDMNFRSLLNKIANIAIDWKDPRSQDRKGHWVMEKSY